jgi:hypothetical protein
VHSEDEGTVITVNISTHDGARFATVDWRDVKAQIVSQIGVDIFGYSTIDQQFDCHVAGRLAELLTHDAGNWDLEAWRPSNPAWSAPGEAVANWQHYGNPAGVCNW